MLRNRVILILFVIFFSNLSSQNLIKEVGDIKVALRIYSIDENQKKKNIGKSKYFFDSSGNIQEIISYGRHHNNNLRLIGSIIHFIYDDEILKEKIKYQSYCKRCKFNKQYERFTYDNKNRLINEKSFNENDSIYNETNYVYKKNTKETYHLNGSTYLQEKYDSKNRIIELNQIFKNSKKIRWQYLYTYKENCKIKKFQTYYGDGKDYSEREVSCYDLKNRLISEEEFSSYKTKITISYSKKGFVKEIKEYACFDKTDNYELQSIIKFKITSKKIDSSILEKINSKLIN